MEYLSKSDLKFPSGWIFSNFWRITFIVSIDARSDWEILFCKANAHAPNVATTISSGDLFPSNVEFGYALISSINCLKPDSLFFHILEKISLIIGNDKIGIKGSAIL